MFSTKCFDNIGESFFLYLSWFSLEYLWLTSAIAIQNLFLQGVNSQICEKTRKFQKISSFLVIHTGKIILQPLITTIIYLQERALNDTLEPLMFSMGTTMQLGNSIYKEIVDMVSFFNNTGRVSDLLQVSAWERAIQNINNQFRIMASQPFDTKMQVNSYYQLSELCSG